MNLEIHMRNLELNDEMRSFVDRRIEYALGRFSPAVKSVNIRVGDDNGPRGGIDKHCRIVVHLERRDDVVVDQRGETYYGTVATAIDRVENAVSRAIRRRRDALVSRKRFLVPLREQDLT